MGIMGQECQGNRPASPGKFESIWGPWEQDLGHPLAKLVASVSSPFAPDTPKYGTEPAQQCYTGLM